MTSADHAPLCSQLVSENADTSDTGNEGRPDPEAPAATNYFLQYISSRWAVTCIFLHGGMLGALPKTLSWPQLCLLGADLRGVHFPCAWPYTCSPPLSASPSSENSAHGPDATSNKFIFGQNMSERVLVSEGAWPSLQGSPPQGDPHPPPPMCLCPTEPPKVE